MSGNVVQEVNSTVIWCKRTRR